MTSPPIIGTTERMKQCFVTYYIIFILIICYLTSHIILDTIQSYLKDNEHARKKGPEQTNDSPLLNVF